MKKMKVLFFAAIVCAINVSFGQKLTSSYIPTLLGDSISLTSFDEVNPIYSSESSTLYFTRRNHPENKFGEKDSEDIWFSELQKDSSWTTPKRLPDNVNNSKYNNVLSVVNGGNSLLLSGQYTKKGVWYRRGLSIVSKSSDSSWTSLEDIKIPGFQNVNDGDVLHAFMNDDQTVLFFSFDKQHLGNKNNLFVSLKNKKGKWSRPKVLTGIDKAGSSETCPWLSENGDTLFFASDLNGHFDLYQVERDSSGKKYLDWLTPSPLLNDGINTDKNESFSSLNKRNDIAFFASDREGTWDIYKVRRFERYPYVLVRGTVFNQFKNAPIEEKYRAKLLLQEVIITDEKNDTIPFVSDSLVFDTITSEYVFKVPFGKELILSGDAENFISHEVMLTTKGIYEYSETVQNVELEPLLYADVKGVVLDSVSNEILSVDVTTLNPQIFISELPYESAIVDSVSSFGGVRLALGAKYAIYAQFEGYDGVVDSIDLTGFESYIDTSITLLINKQPDPFMYISGQFKSMKDSTSISGDTKVYLSGKLQGTELVDGSKFTLKVPLNDSSLFHVHMHGYLDYEDTLIFKGDDRLDTTLTVYLTPIEEGMKMVIDHVYFENAKAVLKETSYPALDQLVAFLNEYPKVSIEISGHTDDIGSEKYNLKLSEKRAKAVGDYLLEKGILKERVITMGEGFSKPLVENNSDENRAKNRRVEFLILKK